MLRGAICQRYYLPYSGCKREENEVKAFFWAGIVGYFYSSGQCYQISSLDGHHPPRPQIGEHFHHGAGQNQGWGLGNEQSNSWSQLTHFSEGGNSNILRTWNYTTSTLFLSCWHLGLGMRFLLPYFSLAPIQRCNYLNFTLFCHWKRSEAYQRKFWRVHDQLYQFFAY